MNTKMRQTDSAAVTEILVGSDLYNRHSCNTRQEISWFVANDQSWDWVGTAKQELLESEWQELTNPAPAPLTEEEQEELEFDERNEQQDALNEQMWSEEYERTFY
jgi:hypothetical protein